ncbi:hypothetical protein JRG19_02570 [Pseudoclavibacter alba]|uniref:hypothetical protein n=1 Tax=Pseudoclavibacter albus TaxID=272241 RepID=UPI0019D23357|nr:hypothetical protein [Pseudoclavibacter alba]MBN6777434.1 hypothetical protein [Pseudoclavibacter alba]
MPTTKKTPTKPLDADVPPKGHDMVRPVQSMRSDERMLLMADLQEVTDALGITEGENNIAFTPESLRTFAKIHTLMLENAVDRDAFEEFMRGEEAVTEVTNLAIWYLNQLGK